MVLVVHAANFSVRPKGAFQNNVERKLTNGLIRNGHQVIAFSDREAAMAGSPFGPHRAGGLGYANRALTDLCTAVEPEVLILGQTDLIRPQSVGDLRARLPSMRVLQWSVDALFEPGNMERLTRNFPVVDATLVTTAGDALAPLVRPGKRVGFLPNPVDLSIERGENHLKADPPFDLFYACGNPADLREVGGRAWNMDAFARALMQALPTLKPRWVGLMGQPTLGGAAYQRAIESAALGLNVSRRTGQFLYSSDRLAHLAGNGLAVLIERSSGYGHLFTDDEMAFFSTFDDLVGQIDRLVNDPVRRMSLAAAGRARYHELFNEQRVAAYMLDVALDRLEPSAYPWPTLYAAAPTTP
ncbi:MAG TPA: glycosyltransferase [Caulobacteraceae bacterium]|nr:glycosyltransferase [Caulobacteraceae bacterium]